jgi:hypothetical protein
MSTYTAEKVKVDEDGKVSFTLKLKKEEAPLTEEQKNAPFEIGNVVEVKVSGQ